MRALTVPVAGASRTQDTVLDGRAAARPGTGAVAAAHAAAALEDLFDAYWISEVRPCLDAGFAPPIVEGWRAFLATVAPDAPQIAPSAVAFTRVTDWPAVEAALLARRASGTTLVPLAWERAAEAVWLPRMRTEAEAAGDLLAGTTAAAIAALPLDELADEELGAVGAALAVALHEDGWTLVTGPGRPVMARRGDDLTIAPVELPGTLADRPALRVRWREDAEVLGVADLPLVPRPAPAPAPAVEVVGGTAEVRLATSAQTRRRLRRRAIAWSVVSAFAGLLLAAAIAAPGTGGIARIFVGAVAAAMMAAVALFVRTTVRAARATGTLVIGADTIRLAHPQLLREPWQVPRRLVRTIAVDDADDRRALTGEQVRFLWSDSSWSHPASTAAGALGALWTDDGPLIPMVAAPHDRPTVALVFTEPVPAPRMRRPSETSPLPGEAIGGLLLTAADTSALVAAGLPDGLTQQDVALLVAAETGA